MMEQPARTNPETISVAEPPATTTDDPAERIRAAFKERSARAKQICASAFRDAVTFLKSPTGERFIVLEIFILTAMTLLLFLLYQKELKRIADFQTGLKMIRSVVLGIDPKYEDMDDLQILAVAYNKSEEMRYLANQNDQLQKQIDIISKNMDDGWKLHHVALYWFSPKSASWLNSKRNCEKKGAKLISIETLTEQQYVVRQVKERKKNYWIGLYRDNQQKWKWLPDKENNGNFWMYGAPMQFNCAYMSKDCYSDHKCWATAHCENVASYICKKVPNNAWL